MKRNNKTEVTGVWGGYNHSTPNLTGTNPADRAAWAGVQQIAADIIDGRVPDPTNGATHYYSPQKMPKEGELSKEHDQELEDVPGVKDRYGNHVRNYRRWWALKFEPKPVPSIPERDFKFSKQPEGTGVVQ